MHIQTQNIAPEKMYEMFKLLKYSTMSQAEKKWWMGLTPEMTEEQLDAFLDILREEVSQITNMSLKVAQMRNNRK